MADRLAPSTRHQYKHNGQVVYEWDQTFSEVNIYVPVPPGVRGKQLFVDITTSHLRFGIKPNPPYLDVRRGGVVVNDLAGGVKPSECYWTLEDGVLHVALTKLEEGEPWHSALAGHALDPATQQADQQRLMLERFQVEHPGFDFSQATFNGQVPNPRTFMRGLDGPGGQPEEGEGEAA
ncbi:NudC domain-containing protein 2 [Tetrabaena socialis]|uniref:NudC domain-containing protein 2 n=1 Tax=Tetrabaena socialis TaxID=47790 RepID=A0A2J8AFA7_9CHLO|nr:NudC domain-containing protein 2 [Tetrabaena socialis]|eukprot:PNH11186.1 NudC domain-containing protein 2 [Tetrabaena socialis]